MCNFLFSPMSISPEEDESTTTTTTKSSSSSDHLIGNLFFSSNLLPNSDFYTGQCSSAGAPHGVGKYLWADGCMYEGEWKHGVENGQGKFSWPSGSTYEGQFKSGLMNGYGAKCYSNGDFYDGEWRCGVPHGHGRYLWTNGNEYSGEWREGVIGGKGSFVWVGGNRFDGGWEDGRPVGSGRFRWADGSLYIGVWDKMLEEEKEGLYYPSVNVGDFGRRNPKEFFEIGLKECGISVGENVSVVFSRKFVCFDGVRRKENGEVCDSDEVGEEGRRLSSSSLLSLKNELLPVRLSPRPERKQGVAIWKGHKNYELMLNLQLGIR